jgi:hypothetical protein
MSRDLNKDPGTFKCSLTLEDELVLTHIRMRAKSIDTRADRDQFFWTVIYKLICKERAYKTVLQENQIQMAVKLELVDGDELPLE